MKARILDRESRLVRFAYSLSDFGPPDHTTLCAFFWRAFVFVPLLYILMMGMVIAVMVVIGSYVWKDPISSLFIFLGLVAVVVLGSLGEAAKNNWGHITPERVRNSTFWQGAKSVKGRFCPLIFFKDYDYRGVPILEEEEDDLR